MNKGDLFVALVFYHIFILCGNHDCTLEMVFGSQAVNLDEEVDDGISIPLLRSMIFSIADALVGGTPASISSSSGGGNTDSDLRWDGRRPNEEEINIMRQITK